MLKYADNVQSMRFSTMFLKTLTTCESCSLAADPDFVTFLNFPKNKRPTVQNDKCHSHAFLNLFLSFRFVSFSTF